MRTILLLGAGKSSSALINYFLEHAVSENLRLVVADYSEEEAIKKINGHPSGQARKFNIQNY